MVFPLNSIFFPLLWNYAVLQDIQRSQFNSVGSLWTPLRDSIKTSSLFLHRIRIPSVLQRVNDPVDTLKPIFMNMNTHPSYITTKTSARLKHTIWNTQTSEVTTKGFGNSHELSQRNLMLPFRPYGKDFIPGISSTNMLVYPSTETQTLTNYQLQEQWQSDPKTEFKEKGSVNSFRPVSISNQDFIESVVHHMQPKEVFTFTRKYNSTLVNPKQVHETVNKINRYQTIPETEISGFQNERISGSTNKSPSIVSAGKLDISNSPQAPLRWPQNMKSTIKRNSSSTWQTDKNLKWFPEGKPILPSPQMQEFRQTTNGDNKPQEKNLDFLSAHIFPSRVPDKPLNITVKLKEKNLGLLSTSTSLAENNAKTSGIGDTENVSRKEQTGIVSGERSSDNDEYSSPADYRILDDKEFIKNNETSLLNTLRSHNNLITISGTPQEIQMLKLVDAINNFGLNLYHRLQNRANLFFSPFSLSEAMAIVLEGATNMTATQIMNKLHFSSSNIRQDEIRMAFQYLIKSLTLKSSSYELENANLLLLKNKCPFKNEFSSNVYKYYNPLLGSVDFASYGSNIMKSVNDWVSRHTHGKINEFLSEPLSPNTVLAILNAVYFRGQWKNPFRKSSTYLSTFFNYGYQPTQVDMMVQSGAFATFYSKSLRTKAIELAYHGDKASMVILLPEKRDGIKDLQKELNYQSLNDMLSSMRNHSITLSLPRFSLHEKYEMGDIFKEMGMKDMFSPGKASFGKMTNVTGLYVSDLYHEGAVDIDEKGTEAAAGTGISIIPLSARNNIQVDHPFIFVIRNKINGLILFIGQLSAILLGMP